MNQAEVYYLSLEIENHLADNCLWYQPQDVNKTVSDLVREVIEKYLENNDQ